MDINIGMKAPDFTAMSTFGPITLSDYAGQWVIFFSHPGDFTPVCTTEFITFSQMNNQFEQLNAKLLGLSIDSNPSHLAWVNQIHKLTGVQIPFPVIADRLGDVARLYGMISADVNRQETVRDVFFIDPNQIIRAILIYPIDNGRNIFEIMRLLTALQITDKCDVVTPANWQPGNPTMLHVPTTYSELVERANQPPTPELNCLDWFWCYTDTPCESTE